MNSVNSLLVGIIVLICVLACDSPPWARCIVANATEREMKVRFSTRYSMFSDACTYSPEDWSANARSCTLDTRLAGNLEDGPDSKWLEITIPSGGALEVTRYRYPEIEENVDDNFPIDELQINGSAGIIAWSGRKEIFSHLKKEGDVPWWHFTGNTPRYVFYYK
jgi:hypothetical protein